MPLILKSKRKRIKWSHIDKAIFTRRISSPLFRFKNINFGSHIGTGLGRIIRSLGEESGLLDIVCGWVSRNENWYRSLRKSWVNIFSFFFSKRLKMFNYTEFSEPVRALSIYKMVCSKFWLFNITNIKYSQNSN